MFGERVKYTVAQIPWGVWDEAVCLQPLVNNVRKRREVNAKIFSFLFALTASANQKSFAISPPPLASHIHFTIGHRQGLLGYLMSKTQVINKCQGELMWCFWKDLANSRALGRHPGICRIKSRLLLMRSFPSFFSVPCRKWIFISPNERHCSYKKHECMSVRARERTRNHFCHLLGHLFTPLYKSQCQVSSAEINFIVLK